MSEASEMSDEILLLCGYVRVHQVLAGPGDSVSFSLFNGWNRLTVTRRSAGGSGSALGEIQEINVWAVPESQEQEVCWRYDLIVSVSLDGALAVVAVQTEPNTGGPGISSQQGTLVELNPPSAIEMLAAQAGKEDVPAE